MSRVSPKQVSPYEPLFSCVMCMGAAFGFIPADKHTLQAEKWKNVWIIGDAGSVPAPKSGSVAHFMLEVVVENIG